MEKIKYDEAIYESPKVRYKLFKVTKNSGGRPLIEPYRVIGIQIEKHPMYLLNMESLQNTIRMLVCKKRLNDLEELPWNCINRTLEDVEANK